MRAGIRVLIPRRYVGSADIGALFICVVRGDHCCCIARATHSVLCWEREEVR